MQLSDKAIHEFQALYEAQFGVRLEEVEARETAEAVITFVAHTYGLDDVL